MASSPSFSVILVPKCPEFPDKNTSLGELDAQSSRCIEMVGLFKTPTPMSFDSLVSLLKSGGDGYIYIVGNDDLADFVSKNLVVANEVDRYDGHPKPSMVAKPVENTAMGDFFGSFSRGVKTVPTHPDSSRVSVLISEAGILKTVGGLQVSYNKNEPLSERLFSFIKEPIYDNKYPDKGDNDAAEKLDKQNKDTYPKNSASKAAEILQSPRAFSRRDVARAKKIQQTSNKITIGITFLLYIAAFIWSAEARPFPGGSSQSANVTSFEKEKSEDDARNIHCWAFEPTPAPTSPSPINDKKKGEEKPEDYAMYLQCWLLAPAPALAPTSLAPINDIDDKKVLIVKEKLEEDAMRVQCQLFAPTHAPTSPAPINEKEKPKDGAMYLKCLPLAPAPAPTSPAHIDINDDKKENPKLLDFCGYPCCGFNIHGPCDRCCPKGVLRPPSP